MKIKESVLRININELRDIVTESSEKEIMKMAKNYGVPYILLLCLREYQLTLN